MEYTIETRQQGRQPYVAVRTTVPMATIGDAMGRQFGQLFGWLGSHGVTPAGPPFARYLSVGRDEVEFEVAAPVAAEMTGDAGVIAGAIPACEVAETVHIGAYDRLPDAYTAVGGWMGANGCDVSGAMWEVYLSDPASEPDPSRWRTLVCYPFMRR